MDEVKFKKGRHFEEKIVQAMIVDHQFAEQMLEVLNVAFFNVNYLKDLVDIFFNYYGEYSAFPTFKTLLLVIKDKIPNEILRTQVVNYLIKISKDPLNGDAEYIKEESLDFCKRRSLAIALEESLGYINEKKFEQIVPVIQKALMAGTERDIGHIFNEATSFQQRMTSVLRNPIPTPWAEINAVTQGGFSAGELWTCAASTGCHAKGQEVLMYDGSCRKAEDVKIGDLLMGPDSEPRAVHRLIRGSGKLYEVTTRWGYKAIFNEDHTLALQSSVTKEHSEMTIKDYVNETAHFKHIHFWYQPENGIDFSVQKYLAVDPYILGILLGDGYIAKHRVEITTADSKIVDEIKRVAALEGVGVSEHKKRDNIASGWYFTNGQKHNNPFIAKLQGLDLVGTRSDTKFIPFEYLTSSRKDRLELFAGLVDSDGYNTGQGYEIVSKSKKLASDIAFLARSLGFYVTERLKKVPGYDATYYRLSIGGDVDQVPSRLSRKQIKLSGKRNTRPYICKFSVEAFGAGEYFGFTVDKDNLYLSKDMAVIRNCGKSHWLVDVGHHAVKLGYNVVHYTLELSDLIVGKRYDARFSGVPMDQLVDHQDQVWRSLEALEGSVIIKSYPCKAATALTLRSHIHKLTMKDRKPDLILVDYGDLMRSSKRHDHKRFEEEAIYEELRNLGGELKLPIVTVTQTNRASLDEEIVTLKHVAECFQKAMLSDVFLTIARRKQNTVETPGNFYLAKNRLGPDGIKFNIMANTSISKFRIVSDQEEGDLEDPHERLRAMAKHLNDI